MDELARFNQQRWEALARARILYSRPKLDLDEASARDWLDEEGLLGPVAGKDVLPLAVGRIAAQLEITPEVIRKSLTVRMICSTDIDPAQVQRTIDYAAALGYIPERFEARQMLHLELLDR